MSTPSVDIPFFFLDSFSNWTWSQTILVAIGNTIALELLSWVVFLLETPSRPRIAPGGPLVWERGMIDWVYIWTNKLGTACFNYHLFQYCYWSGNVSWAIQDMTIFNTIVALPLLFACYDLFYAPFHRFLHARAVYGYVHKHHHKQRAPMYGNDDAINTHPIEFWLGAYCHILAIYLVPCHMAAVLVFLMLITLMSALNHTRFEVSVGNGYLYDNREHDTHHRLLACNYAAYTQMWDWLMGTYKPWSQPQVDYLNWKPIQNPDYTSISATKKEYERVMKLNDAPKSCLVTGASGLVGSRLVSMLIQRGAEKVIALDLTPCPEEIRSEHKRILGSDVSKIEYIQGDITDSAQMTKLCKGLDCLFNVAAIVGPYYPIPLYDKVNNVGVRVLVDACKANKVPKMIMTSSPSTRMDGNDIYNKREDELPAPDQFVQLQEYARTKALGEQYALSQNSDDFLVCAIGPHQVYGPMDRLMLPAFLETASTGRLRVLGTGQNVISFTHTDNCAHSHILASAKLVNAKTAPAGKYYIVTDGGCQYMWDAINQANVSAGFTNLLHKFNVNTCLLVPISHLCLLFSKVTGMKVKLNPFVVKMVSINRYFNIDNLRKDIGYNPIRSFDEAWPETCEILIKRMGWTYTKYEVKDSGRIATASDTPDVNDDGHGKKH